MVVCVQLPVIFFNFSDIAKFGKKAFNKLSLAICMQVRAILMVNWNSLQQ